MSSLAERRPTPERMDDPAIDPGRLDHALRGIARINTLSRSARLVWTPIRRLAQRDPGRTLRVLDVATGAGDVPIILRKRANVEQLSLEVEACDLHPLTLAHARRRAERAGMPMHFFRLNITEMPPPDTYDIVIASLFLHHLSTRDATIALRHMAAAARALLVVSDLRRTTLGLLLAYAASRLVTRSDVVHFDAPASVRSAFTVNEVHGLAHSSGLEGARIRCAWPQRFVLEWERRG